MKGLVDKGGEEEGSERREEQRLGAFEAGNGWSGDTGG